MRRRAGVTVALLLAVAACTDNPGPRRTTVTVFAAASLSKAFVAEGKAFEAQEPGVRVTFSFAGSQALVAQLRQGAPADVLATADAQSMTALGPQVLPRDLAPVVFAHNELAVVTARGNPRQIHGLLDLARPDLRVVIAGPAVPVGRATSAALREARVTLRPVSLEDSVSGVVGKVRLGEADVGIAYVTDLRAAGGDLTGFALEGTSTDLSVAALNPRTETLAFVGFLSSPEGQRVLASYGFT